MAMILTAFVQGQAVIGEWLACFCVRAALVTANFAHLLAWLTVWVMCGLSRACDKFTPRPEAGHWLLALDASVPCVWALGVQPGKPGFIVAGILSQLVGDALKVEEGLAVG
jgi:hypothetical protein